MALKSVSRIPCTNSEFGQIIQRGKSYRIFCKISLDSAGRWQFNSIGNFGNWVGPLFVQFFNTVSPELQLQNKMRIKFFNPIELPPFALILLYLSICGRDIRSAAISSHCVFALPLQESPRLIERESERRWGKTGYSEEIRDSYPLCQEVSFVWCCFPSYRTHHR